MSKLIFTVTFLQVSQLVKFCLKIGVYELYKHCTVKLAYYDHTDWDLKKKCALYLSVRYIHVNSK